MVAGIFGAIFPSLGQRAGSVALPQVAGMAIGMLGIGSGLGFSSARRSPGGGRRRAVAFCECRPMAKNHALKWPSPDLVVGIIFLAVGSAGWPRVTGQSRKISVPRRKMVRLAVVLMFRDFAGRRGAFAGGDLCEKVFGLSVEEAGLFVGVMMLPSVIVNPLAGLSDAGAAVSRSVAGEDFDRRRSNGGDAPLWPEQYGAGGTLRVSVAATGKLCGE